MSGVIRVWSKRNKGLLVQQWQFWFGRQNLKVISIGDTVGSSSRYLEWEESCWSQQTQRSSAHEKQTCWGYSSAMQGQNESQRLPVSQPISAWQTQRADSSHRHHGEIRVGLCGLWRDDTPALHGLSAAQALQCKQAYRRQAHFHTSVATALRGSSCVCIITIPPEHFVKKKKCLCFSLFVVFINVAYLLKCKKYMMAHAVVLCRHKLF